MEDKPNINQQLEAYIVKFLNDSGIQYKAGTGGEEDSAKAGLAKLVKVVLFVNEYRSKLGKDQKMKYRGSEILTSVKHCIRAKACPAKLEDLSKKRVLSEFKKACAAAESFPASWYRYKADGDRFAEPILAEIGMMVDIIGTHLDNMNEQDFNNWQTKRKTTSNLPTASTTKTSIIRPKMVLPKIKSTHLQNLYDDTKSEDAYTLFHLTDELMGIDKGSIPDYKSRSRARGKFMNLPSRGTVVCAIGRMEKCDDKSCGDFQGFVQDATRQAPVLLSTRQTNDAVNSIATASGKSKRFSKALLSAILDPVQ